MRPSLLLNLKALQLYVVALVGALCYLHFSYGHSRDRSLEASEISSSHYKLSAPSSQDYYSSGGPANRFIVGLNFWEQLTMATSNLLSLVCLGEQWNAVTVQPFTFNSRLYGLKNFKPDDNFKENKSAHALDLIYDMDSFSKMLVSEGLPRMATFGTFLEHASREVVVVHYISSKETHELVAMKGVTKTRLERAFRQDPVVDCKNHLPKFKSMIENTLNEGMRSHRPLTSRRTQFRVAKYWCVNMSEFSTPSKSALKMGFGTGEDDATVVILNWRGVGAKQVIKNSAKGVHLNNRVAMMDSCHHHLSLNHRDMIGYSSKVIETAGHFSARLGIAPTDEYIAVHIRSEKLGLREKRLSGVMELCFNELMRQVDAVTQKHPHLRVVYITDYGPYSSDTCRQCKGSKDAHKLLLKRNINTVYFDPAQFNTTLDSGFAAAVESQFLASASMLLLCGGGGFQTQISARFQSHRAKNNMDRTKGVFRICTDDSDISKLTTLNKRNPAT